MKPGLRSELRDSAKKEERIYGNNDTKIVSQMENPENVSASLHFSGEEIEEKAKNKVISVNTSTAKQEAIQEMTKNKNSPDVKQDSQKSDTQLRSLSLRERLKPYNCTKLKKLKNKARQCSISGGKQYATKFYIIDAPDTGKQKLRNTNTMETNKPIVLVTGGVHGTEPAGMLAASEIYKQWVPRKGHLVVIPVINVCGARKHSRYLKCSKETATSSQSMPDKNSQGQNSNDPVQVDDLNRDFPPNEMPKSDFANDIWDLVSLIRPNVFLDLHEGWGFYVQLKDNPHNRLVGNTRFSKGSSVIAAPNALKVAEAMVDEVNKGVKDEKHKFLLSTPPVEEGLAMHLYQSFGTISMVQETTVKGQPLELRASQHVSISFELYCTAI
uniref:Succinylglutamate desuccinylase/Aspartoacylase catalytic domain-containing protein n=1 Tax=Aplanochytrium stocchinoi TaxID=215587 RepID=A0A7S3LKC3_9STRA